MTTATSPQGAATAAPPGGSGLALTAIVGAEFMLQVDGMIVNVALPDTQSDLGLSTTSASWVLNGFFLAFGGLLLLSGRLGDVFGHRRLFLLGIGLVAGASLLAGLAPNFGVLLTGRVLQGAGAALAGPTGLALLSMVFQGERQQRAFGLYSTITGLGAATGLILGGILTGGLGSWRWCLLVNVPFGLIILVIALRSLGTAADGARSRSLSLPSAALVTAGLTALVYGLVQAADRGWGDLWTVVPLAITVVVAAALLVVDRRAPEPLLPGRIFTNRTRVGGFINLLLLSSVLGGFVFYLSQYLQTTLDYGALRTGLAILPFGLALLVTTQLLTKWLSGLGLTTRGTIGLALLALGVAWFIRLDADSAYAEGVLPGLVVMGLGVGLAIIPLNMIILSTSRPEDVGITAGILQAALTVGGSIGLAVLLIPFNAGGRPVAENISTVFTWATVDCVAGFVVAVLFWFGPGLRPSATRTSSPEATAPEPPAPREPAAVESRS
ncbi:MULTISPECIES: MFS transporter [Frankia]|uniref:Transmembrane efflux protein n=1 Tax=Frankia alni (strain DSM 45986 / CECT 9034 / ACN14a) TaxID=326424 RepID=Q0RID4_FRAAA|nr:MULTISPECIES: MFS transporter [Frankia]CAJ62736.1 putative transmembrane efflux protein [Frankia alni ACN14a]